MLMQRRSAMKVKDAMHKGVDWVSPETPVSQSLQSCMCEHDIGAIPIGENDRLIGMVDRPRHRLQRIGATANSTPAAATAREVMTAENPLLPRGRRPRQGGASHGGAEGPPAAGDQRRMSA